VIVITAVARELCGFVWAIVCQVSAPEKVTTRQKGAGKEADAEASVPPTPIKTAPSASKKDYPLGPAKKFKK
jgi:hypothetical protein